MHITRRAPDGNCTGRQFRCAPLPPVSLVVIPFRGQLCYIDAYTEPYVPHDFDASVFGESREEYIERLRNFPTHLCRLRYFGDEDCWSMAFYTYSHEKYEPCAFNNGGFHGTPEEAFETSAVYLEN